MEARNCRGLPAEAVARFHRGNGARLECSRFLGDRSEKGLRSGTGPMVNHACELDELERNHERLANEGGVATSVAVRRLLHPLGDHKPGARP